MYQKGRKTEAGARRARGHKIWSQCIFFVIWDLIHRLQLAKNCDLKFCLYQLPLMYILACDQIALTVVCVGGVVKVSCFPNM